jgi:hypothetical protein
LDLFLSSPALADVERSFAAAFSGYLGIACQSPDILKRSTFYFRNLSLQAFVASLVVSAYKFFSIWLLSA